MPKGPYLKKRCGSGLCSVLSLHLISLQLSSLNALPFQSRQSWLRKTKEGDFIYIADELYKLNNFSSFIAIINALEGSAISHFHASWNKVSKTAVPCFMESS